MLRRKLHESLTVRIFLITLLILLGAGAITFALIAWATPSTYTAVVNSDLAAQVDALAGRLAAFPDLPMAPPYEGAKDYILVEDIDDTETLTALASLTCEALRASERPKRRKYGCI